MTMGTLHTTWLSLIDRSGPFLSVQVLETALPQGLDVTQSKYKQKLRLAYEEWRDAVDQEDLFLQELSQEWIKIVLKDILEYDEASLFLNTDSVVKYRSEEQGSEYVPTYFVKTPLSDHHRFYIDVFPPGTDFDKPIPNDQWAASIIERMTLLCRSQKVRYGLLTDGERWVVVSAPIGATSGTATWYARLWRYEPVTLKAFQTLLGARRCFGPDDSNLDKLLDNSLSSYDEVTNTLGEQVRRAVEVLIQSLDSADQDRNRELLKDVSPSELYDASVTVMMRLVFILCAEERGLLLLGDSNYDQYYAVATLRAQLAEEAGRIGPEVLERRHDAWSRLLATFRVIFGGIEHESLRLPPLGGSLFDPDKYPFLEGRKKDTSWKSSASTPLPIDNRTVLLLLTALQVLEQKGGALHLSYRSLDVEQIGHVYEGLLDSTVSRVSDVTLAIQGSKQMKSFLIKLSSLEEKRLDGQESLLLFLEEETERKSTSLQRSLNASISEHEFGKLLLSCGGDEELATKIKPYYHILRTDIWGHPLVYKSGSYAVTLGLDRRETGTHYTPKALTETIVSLTLEPLIYNGPSENLEKSHWVLKSSAEILKLRVCDPAMGSAAFLVQACKYLSEHLVMAWHNDEKVSCAQIELDSIGNLPLELHERLLVARRLVTECCLYGVDINPLAVELAKLSLWLITMSKGKPFEFLDHNFKSGDSIVGLHSIDQLRKFHITKNINSNQISFFNSEISKSIDSSIQTRLAMREIRVRDIKDIEKMSDLNKKASSDILKLKMISDSICGLMLVSNGKNKNFELSLENLEVILSEAFSGDEDALRILNEKIRNNLTVEVNEQQLLKRPFHWPLEFPEVFINSNGFDALIGNPPFIGGRRMRGAVGAKVLDWLTLSWPHASMNADYCSFFFLQAARLLSDSGYLGFLATKTIGQGDTAKSGLAFLIKTLNVKLVNVESSFRWPGSAAVIASRIIATKSEWKGPIILDNKNVSFISPILDDKDGWGEANVLPLNVICSNQGSILLGTGFLIDTPKALELLEQNPTYSEVLRPYLDGDDLNTSPEQKPTRWVIDFHDFTLEKCRSDYPLLINIVERLIKPQRDSVGAKNWWHHWRNRAKLYKRIRQLDEVFVIARVTKYVAIVKVPTNYVFHDMVYIFDLKTWSNFSCLQSSFHDIWVRRGSSTVGETLRYTPSDYFDTYPFLHISDQTLESIGEKYHLLRKQIMLKNKLGLTEVYNRLNSIDEKMEDFLELRNLQVELDLAVAKAYGWTDIDFNHDFYETKNGIRYSISEDSKRVVLKKLLELNQQVFLITEKSEKTKKIKLKNNAEEKSTDDFRKDDL